MVRRRIRDRWLWGSTVVSLTAVLLLAVWETGWLRPLERIAHDQRIQLLQSGSRAPSAIALIMVDEASLAAMDPVVGRWPWPRDVFADVLDFLQLGNPRAVVFDILFTEEGGEGDRLLARSTAAQGNVIHAAQFLPDDQRLHPKPLPEGVFDRFSVGNRGSTVAGRQYRDYRLPLRPLRQAARRLGVVSVQPDPDGVYRRIRPVHAYAGHLYPALGPAPLLGSGVTVEAGRLWDAQGAAVYQDAAGRTPVNVYDSFDSYSMSAVLASVRQVRRGEVADLPLDPGIFEDRVVFIGASAVGLHDLRANPLDGAAPGVHLHASLAGNLLAGEHLAAVAPRMNGLAIAVLALLSGLGILAGTRLSFQVGVPFLLIVTWTVWVLWQQAAAGTLWAYAGPVTAILAVSLAGFAFLGFTEGRERVRIHRMLGQYVSPNVLEEVLDQERGAIGADVGTSEHLTILFSDLRGFTTLSEQLPAEQLVEALNAYLGVMADRIFEQRGTLDKFIGDAILAFWGAPLAQPDHAERAVRGAFAMVRALPEVNRQLDDLGLPPLAHGIGIHSGEAILGNIGSEKKLDYTVVGDAVNLASRVEGLTKAYGFAVLITEDTRDQLPEGFICMQVELVRVKGRHRPVAIHAPLALPEDPEAERSQARSARAAAEEGFRHYLAREWAAAETAFGRLAEGPLREHLMERCRAYAEQPPPADWDGVVTMENK